MQLIQQRKVCRPDDGFSLIELIVAVAILGVISAGLIGIVFQYLKVTDNTRSRLTESTDQQFISTYWQNDVSSLGRRGFNPAAADPVPTSQSVFVNTAGPQGCGSEQGTVVVAFAWQGYPIDAAIPADAWTTTPEEVAYVRVGGAAPFKLQRVRCHSGVVAAVHTVAHNLTGDPVNVTCDTTCTADTLPNRVSMEFTVRDASEPESPGYTTTVSADRRQS